MVPEITMKLSLLTPLLFLLFGGFIAIYSYRTFGDIGSFGAGFMPAAIGGLMVFFSLLDLLITWLKRATDVSSDAGAFWRDIGSIALVSGLIIFYICAVDTLGFMLTSSLMMLVLLLRFLEGHRIMVVVGAVALSAGIYYLFSSLLLVPLPAGSLF